MLNKLPYNTLIALLLCCPAVQADTMLGAYIKGDG